MTEALLWPGWSGRRAGLGFPRRAAQTHHLQSGEPALMEACCFNCLTTLPCTDGREQGRARPEVSQPIAAGDRPKEGPSSPAAASRGEHPSGGDPKGMHLKINRDYFNA